MNTDEKYDITERKQDLQHMVNLLADAFATNELYLDARNTLSRLLGGIELPEPEAVAASQRAGR